MKHLFFACVLFFTVSVSHALTGMVVKVPDGDSLTVRTTDGAYHRLRLYGIDSPEKNQDWGEQARKAAFSLAINRLVDVEVLYYDQYNRMVAIVTLPSGRILQEVMLEKGMSWVYEGYCKHDFCDKWRIKMENARSSRRGLWQEVYPYPPWEWRKAKRKEVQWNNER